MSATIAPREERLRGATGTLAHPLSVWRGRSGNRYVVSIRPIESIEADDLLNTVAIAVRRDGPGFSAGIARSERIRACEGPTAVSAFLAGLPKAVTEIHVHSLADGPAERAAIAADLSDGGRS